ncbi:MAG: hypothetical protein ABWU84_12650, partial [Pyrobaculum sp.]|uniref:hypothetical protein n=1 Tax=Pyrobaculum sp. TaxID=2004705 RepID=UPI003EF041FE
MKFFTIIVPPEKREDAVRRLQLAAFKTGISDIGNLAIFQDGDYIWAEYKIKTDKKISTAGVKA